ncbi:nuclear transport factor 2 family protein [Comamonas kerstersii]|uniref:nuclear transport factor 2 family protein n=1 Tax=Comamonas kerstersii TaxID=225992 RepID=UPI00345CF0C4
MCASLLSHGGAHASPAAVDEVQQLMEKGQLSAAAQRVQAQLKKDSSDVQLRFLQAVIAAEQKKYDQAIRLFTALTQDHPTLPEPYNNLAVIYAFRGEDRKAAQVLEQAIRTNPSYATAHQNLGDVYARIANEAYAKALQLDNAQKAEKPKLTLISRIATPAATASALPAPTAAAVTIAAATAPVPTPVPAPAPEPAPTPAPAAPITTTPAPAEPAATAAPPAAPAPEPKPAATPAKAAADSAAEHNARKAQAAEQERQAMKAVEKAVTAWASAWEQQNMNAYYAAYSNRFDPQGMSLSAWKAERKNRIVGKPAISVKISDLKITVNGDRASASFRQQYSSGGYRASTNKTLRMQNEGGKWRITREETGR